MENSAESRAQKFERIAKTRGITSRTLYRWHAKGCDIDSAESLEAFDQAAQARSRGNQRKKVLARRDGSREGSENEQNGDSGGFDSEFESLPEPGEKGAAAALKRLQEFEAHFAARLQRALELNKAGLINTARDDHIKIAEALRRYEREVEESARDLGHLIPKEEAMRGARAAAIWFRLAWRSWLSSCLPDVLALASDARDAKHKCEETFSAILSVALKNAQEAVFTMPEWASGVIKEEFRCE